VTPRLATPALGQPRLRSSVRSAHTPTRSVRRLSAHAPLWASADLGARLFRNISASEPTPTPGEPDEEALFGAFMTRYFPASVG
jgi:hypothetical protein